MVSQPTIPPEADAPFIEYLTTTAGDQLVGIIRYSENNYTIEHHRDEFIDYLNTHVEEIVALHKARESAPSSHSDLDVGSRHATVRLYERVIVIDFPHPNADGIIVVFQPSVAPRLAKFVQKSEHQLQATT